VALGTSLTATFFGDKHVDDLGPDGRPRRLFNLALPASRAVDAFGVWRNLLGASCTPRRVYLEVSPSLVNLGGPRHGGATISLASLFALPRSTWLPLARELSWGELAEITTWEQLLVVRRRVDIRNALAGLWSGRRRGGPRPYPRDGRILGPLADHFDREDAAAGEWRERAAEERIGRHRVDAMEATALRALIAAIRARGVDLVLFTPPMSPTFYAGFERNGGKASWCPFVASLAELGLPWLDATASGYAAEEFVDQVHLNAKGASRFGRELSQAVSTHTFPAPRYCR